MFYVILGWLLCLVNDHWCIYRVLCKTVLNKNVEMLNIFLMKVWFGLGIKLKAGNHFEEYINQIETYACMPKGGVCMF